jgi:hypothetical protein
MAKVDSFTTSMGQICHELNASHTHENSTLQKLIDRYDATAQDTHDGTLAYGNKLVMLRLMVQLCVDRLNTLLATTHIQPIPSDSTYTVTTDDMRRVLGEINREYAAGVDMALATTAVVTQPQDLDVASSPLGLPTSQHDMMDPTRVPIGRQRKQTDQITTPIPFSASVSASAEPTTIASTTHPTPSTATPEEESNAGGETKGTRPLPTELAHGNALSTHNATSPPIDPKPLPQYPSPTQQGAELVSRPLCHACSDAAILEECEICSHFFCSNCLLVELDRGLHWCNQCRTSTPDATGYTSNSESSGEALLATKPAGESYGSPDILSGDDHKTSSPSSDTSVDSSFSLTSTTRSARQRKQRDIPKATTRTPKTRNTGRSTSTESDKESQASYESSQASDISSFSQKSTIRRSRHRKTRSASPQPSSKSVSTKSTASLTANTARSKSIPKKSTLDAYLIGRPRRSKTTY